MAGTISSVPGMTKGPPGTVKSRCVSMVMRAARSQSGVT